MELNRNHFFAAGIVILLLGLQLHSVKTFVLSEQATTFLAKQTGKMPTEPAQSSSTFLAASGPRPIVKKSITPPEWIGWFFISFGSVLILHSWALPRPNP